jgi:hypothetical protein
LIINWLLTLWVWRLSTHLLLSFLWNFDIYL